jgi:hypothetical protein
VGGPDASGLGLTVNRGHRPAEEILANRVEIYSFTIEAYVEIFIGSVTRTGLYWKTLVV